MRAIPWEELGSEQREKYGNKAIYEAVGPCFDNQDVKKILTKDSSQKELENNSNNLS